MERELMTIRPIFSSGAHARDQVLGPLGGGEPPVLVRRELAVAVEVSEAESVDLDDGGATWDEIGT